MGVSAQNKSYSAMTIGLQSKREDAVVGLFNER